MPNEHLLGFLRELERADEEVAATLAELDGLAAEVEDVRATALALDRKIADLPAERDRLRTATEEAKRTVEARRADLRAAERNAIEAREAGNERRLAAARHDVVRASDSLRMADRAAAGLAAESERIGQEASAAESRAPALLERGSGLAERLRSRPRLASDAGESPSGGLAGLAEWASTARAALFVARGSLASERDAVIRQANELGALVLGEAITTSSTADVARRIEQSG